MNEIWWSWAYHYGVGGLLWALALLALARAGALPEPYSAERWIVGAACGGLMLFAAIHAVWIFLASG